MLRTVLMALLALVLAACSGRSAPVAPESSAPPASATGPTGTAAHDSR